MCFAGGRKAAPPVAVFAEADLVNGVYISLRRTSPGKVISVPDGAVYGTGSTSRTLSFITCYAIAARFALDDDLAVSIAEAACYRLERTLMERRGFHYGIRGSPSVFSS